MKKSLLLSVFFAFLLVVQAWAQSRPVSGKVTDQATGQGLPGVSVIVKGTTVGATTSADGSYNVSVPANGTTLVFRYIGYTNLERPIGNASTINVAMSADDKQLSELVVVGYGTQNQRTSTQSIATVDAEAFKNTPQVAPQQLLQGQAAGVQMTNSSGVLGAAAAVRIRGAASITAGGEPLYVIDGVPLNDGAYSFRQGGAAPLNPLLNINPNDIESMSVLKDASAVAIYGSRGANGVVLINTKSGSKGKKTTVNFDYFTGVSEATNVLKYMSGEEYKQFRTEYNQARGGSAPSGLDGESFDWVDAVLQTGKTQNYSLSARGGNEKTAFYIGGSYSDESGFTIGNELQKLSGRFNLTHNVTDNIKVGVNYSLSNSDMRRVGVENSTAAPLTGAYLQNPFITPYGPDGNFQNTGFIVNAVAQNALTKNDFNIMRSTGNAFAEFTFLKDFKFKTDWGMDFVQTDAKYRDPDILSPGGYGYRNNVMDNKWLTTNTLGYNKFLTGGHTIGVLLGHSFETSRYDDIFVEGSGFASDDLPNVGSASTPLSTSATGSEWALESYFGRVNYDFNSKYLFEATLRRDGSSRFGADYKYGTFYAASAGWVLTEEEFLKNIDFLNFLKLKTSYGTAGNDRIGNFSYLGLFAGGSGADYNGNSGLIPTTVPNPELRWEETAQFDVTMNATIFDRIDLEVSYYDKKTNSLLANQSYPFTTGFASATRNIGKMQNTGVDLMITSRNFTGSDFEWTTSLNMGFVKNEMLSLPEENKDDEGRPFIAGSSAQRAIVGRSLNEFYLVRYAGINPETGDAQWLTKDGEITTKYSSSDRVVVGSAIPDFTGGFTNRFRYKAFDLNAFFNFSYGNKVLIDGLRFTERMSGTFNKSTDLLDYWTPENKDAFAPALSSTTAPLFHNLSTLQLQDGSYLRLKTLSVGYTVPTTLLSKARIFSSARVYVLGQNLWTLTADDFRGPDPEVSGNGGSNQVVGESFFALPQPRTLTAGVNLTF